jgi:hypothetical protein
MRLVGLARDRRALPKAAAVVIGNSNQDSA